MSVTTLNDANFAGEVLEAELPVLVDFYATWCGPCKALSPIVEKLAGEFQGKLKVGKLNIDDSPEAPTRFSVRAVPTLLFFKGGKVVDTAIGFKSENDLRARIQRLLA
jgi:thioredoxin 1